MSKKPSDKLGCCALTGDYGRFVKCHIIPEGLSETLWKDQPLTQTSKQGRQIQRWTSWYDPKLVTQKGEDILQAYDDRAIRILKQHKLVWRGWGPMMELSSSLHDFNAVIQRGSRLIDPVDSKSLRLFFLSVLWRAAATSLWEFDKIYIDEPELEQLRVMVRDGRPDPYDFFPISLIQFCTRALLPFNQVVMKCVKRRPQIGADGLPDFVNEREIEYFRIYFDGLSVSLDINEDPEFVHGGKRAFLNDSSSLYVLTMPASSSRFINDFNYGVGLPVSQVYLTARLISEGKKVLK